MRTTKLVAILLLVSIGALAAGDFRPEGFRALYSEKWLKFTSPNFELYTNAREGRGRDAILHFELARSFFEKTYGQVHTRKIRVVAFSSDNDYRPYESRDGADAFYSGIASKDYIVMASPGSGSYSVAVHEYVHFINRSTEVNSALWLDEGLAEFYSTLTRGGTSVTVGHIPSGRLRELTGRTWIDLATLMSVDRNSSTYKNESSARLFYAESWALAHMLILSEEYGSRTPAFLEAIQRGESSAAAFRQVFGKSLDEVQTDLEAYVKSHNFRSRRMSYEVSVEGKAEKPDIQQLTAWEAGVLLAETLTAAGKLENARTALDILEQDRHDSWEVEAGRGYAAILDGNLSMAEQHFARAAERGMTDAEAYLDYAKLMLREGSYQGQEALAMLEKSVALQPDLEDVHYHLALLLVDEGRYQDALSHFAKVKYVRPEMAFPLFQRLAYACYRLGDYRQARAAADRAGEYAEKPDEIAATEDLVRNLMLAEESNASGGAAAPPVEEASVTLPLLALQEIDAHAEEPNPEPVEPGTPFADGTLQKLDCFGKAALLWLETQSGEAAFMITDLAKVVLTGTADGGGTLECGSQKLQRVRIGYRVPEQRGANNFPVIASIEFQ